MKILPKEKGVRPQLHLRKTSPPLNGNAMVLLFCALLLGCVTPDRRSGLLGSWRCDEESVVITLAFSNDNQYQIMGALLDGTRIPDGQETGRWSIRGTRIFTSTEASPLLPETEGKHYRYEIVKLDANTLVLKGKESPDEPEEIMRFTRLR